MYEYVICMKWDMHCFDHIVWHCCDDLSFQRNFTYSSSRRRNDIKLNDWQQINISVSIVNSFCTVCCSCCHKMFVLCNICKIQYYTDHLHCLYWSTTVFLFLFFSLYVCFLLLLLSPFHLIVFGWVQVIQRFTNRLDAIHTD